MQAVSTVDQQDGQLRQASWRNVPGVRQRVNGGQALLRELRSCRGREFHYGSGGESGGLVVLGLVDAEAIDTTELRNVLCTVLRPRWLHPACGGWMPEGGCLANAGSVVGAIADGRGPAVA
jgi:hypothetical protein